MSLGLLLSCYIWKNWGTKVFQKVIPSWPLKPSQPDAKASGLKLLSFPHLPLGECHKQLTAWQAHPGLTSEQSREQYINQSYGSVWTLRNPETCRSWRASNLDALRDQVGSTKSNAAPPPLSPAPRPWNCRVYIPCLKEFQLKHLQTAL